MVKDAARVARGYKAALNNPHVSEEAKERARQALADMDAKGEIATGADKEAQGYKGSLRNSNASEAEKDRAQRNLKEME